MFLLCSRENCYWKGFIHKQFPSHWITSGFSKKCEIWGTYSILHFLRAEMPTRASQLPTGVTETILIPNPQIGPVWHLYNKAPLLTIMLYINYLQRGSASFPFHQIRRDWRNAVTDPKWVWTFHTQGTDCYCRTQVIRLIEQNTTFWFYYNSREVGMKSSSFICGR